MNYVVRRLFFILFFLVSGSINYSFKYLGSDNYNNTTLCLPGDGFTTKLSTPGFLTVAICNNHDAIYISDGQPQGFKYELLAKFASHLNLKLKLLPFDNTLAAISAIKAGKVDLFSGDFFAAQLVDSAVKLTPAFDSTSFVLVHHKHTKPTINQQFKSGDTDFRGPEAVPSNLLATTHASNLTSVAHALFWRSNGRISLAFTPKPISNILKEVDNGSLAYTVLDKRTAQAQAANYPKLMFNQVVDSIALRWAINAANHDFARYTADWIRSYRQTAEFLSLKAKHSANWLKTKNIHPNKTTASSSGISSYDELLKQLSSSLKWDWRLLAALITKESGFQHFARSPDGAIGLMQIMPSTAIKLGMDSITTPNDNIKGGVRYLKLLQKSWERLIPDPEERIKFVLASYNVGIGHVYDARNLAAKHHYNPNKWFGNVEIFMEKKSLPAYYNDPVVKLGYCRGKIPVKYVSDIFALYGVYCALAQR